jgi:O-antigen/teichoic acid export membrane protein
MQHFVSLFSLIARVRGSITEVAFSQTVIPMLTLLAVLSFKGQTLLLVLVLCYLIGNVLAILLFIWKKLIHFQGRPSRKVCSDIIKKGKYLFIYNVSFYLIFLSTKTIVSVYYPVEEFGFFTFAFTLSNAVLLMMQGFTAIVFPKLIDKFASKKYDDVSLVLHDVRDSYVTTSHAIMYIAFLFFPLLIYFMPKYQGTLDAIMLMGMTFLLYANSFGYSTLLIAQNAEKRLAVISIISLCLNVLVAFVLAVYVKCNYQYVIFATMLAYIFFTCSCVVVGKQIIHEKLKLNSVVADSFPVRLLVPYIIMISAVLMKCNIFVLLTAPLLLGIMNVKQINGIVLLLKRLLYNPNMVDVK